MVIVGSVDAVVMVMPSLLTPVVLAWRYRRCSRGYSRRGLVRLLVAHTHRCGDSPLLVPGPMFKRVAAIITCYLNVWLLKSRSSFLLVV